jgi:hypothetical protein
VNNKLLILILISLLVGSIFIFTKYFNSEVPKGTIKISSKVNGNYLTIKQLSPMEKIYKLYNSFNDSQVLSFKGDNEGYVVLGNNSLRGFCWLPITNLNKTTVFQYVCEGKYHNHYLDIQDKIQSENYLRLILRKTLASASNWYVKSKDDGTFTYENSGEHLKNYYIAIKDDGVAKIYFGDIGPYARWQQNMYQLEKKR